MRQSNARNANSNNFKQFSVSAQVETGLRSKTGDAMKSDTSLKDKEMVFLAGATGRVGSRTVRELLKLGFKVRAGVRSAQRAESLIQSVRQMKLDGLNGNLGAQPVEKLEIVECDLENERSIGSAIGNASIVICCIGASEKEVFDVTGPYRIDYKATKNLIEAATVANVGHFILLTSLGTNKIGFPAAILNLFWGVLCWKRKAEEALISSGLTYTIVRPGGMERPTDSYKETHNLVLADEDTYFGGQVSNLQVAELMAFMAKNTRLSYCKVVEVIAETTAPLTPMEELLSRIPPKRQLPPEPKPEPIPVIEDTKSTSLTTEVETDTVNLPKASPQSPFYMYADLKPPTSPIPTQSSGSSIHIAKAEDSIIPELTNEIESAKASTKRAEYLSPYTAYPDLKPPTSPCPAPSAGIISSVETMKVAKETEVGATPLDSGIEPEEISSDSGNEPDEISTQKKEYLSPYIAYDNLKPPTSPSAPPVNNSTSEIANDGHQILQQKPKPLSPYTMYYDLKPPSSPLPSMPK